MAILVDDFCTADIPDMPILGDDPEESSGKLAITQEQTGFLFLKNRNEFIHKRTL